jgi:ketosteroid isomerase-like protein
MELSKEGQETEGVIHSFFQRSAQADAEAVAELYAEEVDFYIAESEYMPWTGRRINRKEVLEALHLLFDTFVTGEEDSEIDHIFIDEKEAAIFGLSGRTVKATGKKFKEPFCMRFTIENGFITKFLMLEDSRQIEKAFDH